MVCLLDEETHVGRVSVSSMVLVVVPPEGTHISHAVALLPVDVTTGCLCCVRVSAKCPTAELNPGTQRPPIEGMYVSYLPYLPSVVLHIIGAGT